jgi:hypothetical protein
MKTISRSLSINTSEQPATLTLLAMTIGWWLGTPLSNNNYFFQLSNQRVVVIPEQFQLSKNKADSSQFFSCLIQVCSIYTHACFLSIQPSIFLDNRFSVCRFKNDNYWFSTELSTICLLIFNVSNTNLDGLIGGLNRLLISLSFVEYEEVICIWLILKGITR